ncbi:MULTISPECIES: barstar family protein [Streptomyces]|uniref:barstar family protein n=1 Tax=Streptomyces TaxID=1883 RepID=UPI0006AE7BDF|nr:MULTISPECIES: barstar family protein [unclassified Streptomyces]KOU81731.1 LigA protein [Streptomyces sp. XY58]KOV03920.1 LigA protein [Streptomyces sp. XY37]
MMSGVQEKEARRGRTRYRLTDTERGHAWGDCAEAEGLFGQAWRETYELFDWVPEGAGVLGWVGREVWWVPQDGALDPWLLEDAESLGPHPGTDSLVLTGLDDHLGPPEDHRGTVLLHDGRRLLGSCRGFTRILPPRRSDPPIVLRGLTPGEELRRVLATATRRTLDLGEAALEVRDDRGEPFAELLMWVTVSSWRPSALGSGPGSGSGSASASPSDLIDLELEGKLSAPVPEHARPLWERWLAGPPQTTGTWAGLDTRQRWAWLDHVLTRPRPDIGVDRPAGQAYELDGRHVTDVPGLWLALGEAVNGPGGYFGANLDALDDCLGGGFGHSGPGTLLWHDCAVAREHLSHVLTPDGRPYDLFGAVLEVLAESGMRVTLA